MKAVLYDTYGRADVLRLGEIPEPEPREGELLIRVKATSVNPVDWKVRRGDLRFLTGKEFPRVPGIDFAGIVAKVGEGVANYAEGDAVFGILNAASDRLGAAAEFVVAKKKQLARKPEALSFVDAAAIPCAGITARHALLDLARLKPGNAVLVNGASGGVGSFGVQLARHLGARVVGTCSADNVDFVRSLGADDVVDYHAHDVREDLTERFDAFFDAAARFSYWQVRHLLKWLGVYVTTLPMPDAIISAAVTLLLPGRQAKIVMLNGLKPIPEALDDLGQLAAAGIIRPNVTTTYALEDLRDAHSKSETGHATGKIGITLD